MPATAFAHLAVEDEECNLSSFGDFVTEVIQFADLTPRLKDSIKQKMQSIRAKCVSKNTNNWTAARMVILKCSAKKNDKYNSYDKCITCIQKIKKTM